jgi:long-chain acyl-CoA synthetase
MPIRTLSELYLASVKHDKPDCLQHKVDGRFVPISTRELAGRVRALAKALRGLGVQPGDRVAMMAENGPHWPTVDFAVLSQRAVHVPIYPTLLPDQAAYIAKDSGAKVLFVQGRERLEGLLAVQGEMPAVEVFVFIPGTGQSDPPAGVLDLATLVERGAGADEAEFEAQAKAAEPGDLATLIYTSGTTGNPKGVMLSHGNIASNVEAGLKRLDIRGTYTALSFLPLAHSFERTVDYIYFYRGCSIAYAESVQAVAQNLGEVKPHVFVSVPRVYEKVLARVQENAAKSSPTKQKIFRWAVGVGKEALPYRVAQKGAPGLLGLKLAIADRLVFSKIRERLGGRFEFAVSGGAPLGRDVAEFFWGAGVPIYEGYGLTETSPVLTVNGRGESRMGSVGKAVEGVTLHIAADGEILAKGPNIMLGYFNNPTATAEVIDADGWFHTGDIGQIDGDGFLAITDRKKELIVNAYGKNIAPAPIENALKASRWIAQAVVIGDKRQFLTALLVPDFEAARAWAEREGLGAPSNQDLIANAKLRGTIKADVDKVNAELARYEQVRAWELLPNEFTLETGELTPTLKVKRRVILQKYGEILERLYRDHDAG